MSKSEDELFNSSVVPYRILILCVGNTCRSIMYEAILKNQKRANVVIESAGFKAKEDYISENTKRILKENGLPLYNKKPTNIEEINKDITYDEVVILDSKYNQDNLNELKYRKVITHSVFDPEGENFETYEEVFKEIKSIIENGF